MLSVLSDVPCIIQGITSSGKTHLIRLFCELLGRIPLIIDINNDTGISILLKQLVPKEEIEEEKVKKIKKTFKKFIKKEKKLGEEIIKLIKIDKEVEWHPSNFKNVIKLIEDKNDEIKTENMLLSSELKSLLNEQLSFFKHLSNEDSSFIKAMTNGNWVILDGIESAQPELYQRLSSLCDLENQNLTMYDNGPDYVYTKTSKKKKFRIHPDFRLFITYNPFEADPQKRLPNSFLNKCLTFSLSGIDENIKTTSLVLSGLFMKEKLYEKLEIQYYNENEEELKKNMPDLKKIEIIKTLFKEDLRTLGIRFASIHHYSNELAIKNKEDFAGKKTFGGRSIKFIFNTLSKRSDNIIEGIISVIQDIYCYPYKKSQIKLKEDLINKFIDTPIDELMQFLRNDEIEAEEKYKAIMKSLFSIEKNPEICFDMCQFIISTFAYIYKDIPHLIEELEKCLAKVKIDKINYTYISIFRVILKSYLQRKGCEEEIPKSLAKKNINDLDLAKEDEFLRVPQNLLFIYYSLLEKKLIKNIANLDYLKYSEIIDELEDENNEENEEENKEENEDENKKDRDLDNKDNNSDNENEENKEGDNISEENKEKNEEENEEDNDNKKNIENDEDNEDEKEEPLIIISENEKKYIKEKEIKGKQPYLELCLDNSNLVANLATLALSFPELNDMTKEELEEKFKSLPEFTKKLFILFIKLFNNSIYNKDKEEILICEKFSKFIDNKDFIKAIENHYDKEEFFKDTSPEEDKTFLEKCMKIKKELNILSKANLECCKQDDDIIKEYLKEFNENFETYIKDLNEVYYSKIGKEQEYQIKKKFNDLIEKLKLKKTKIDIDFVKGLLDDMIEYLNNITVFSEENYLIAESDVNKILKDSENYAASSSKATLINFPKVEYSNDFKPKTSFQKIYNLLMDFSDTIYLLKDLKKDKDKRTCMNLGKLKQFLKIQEEATFEGIKNQYNIFYDRVLGRDDKLIDIINDFENSVLSNLLLNIYNIDKKYLNKNNLIEKLNIYCSRTKIKEEDYKADLEWASYLSKTREVFDEIILPIFTYNSILKLFSLKNEKGEDSRGMFSNNMWNKNKHEFYKQINELSKYINDNISGSESELTLTIESIFEKAMLTLFKDKENIKNVDEIQNIFKEKLLDKIKIKEKFDLLNIIKEIKEKIQADSSYKEFLEFISDLYRYITRTEKIDSSYSHIDIDKGDMIVGDETKNIIEMIEEKKDIENIDSSIIIQTFMSSGLNRTNYSQDELKVINMDDTFFIRNSDWKNNIKKNIIDDDCNYKKYPSLLYFLFKNFNCEQELREYLSKTDSIKDYKDDSDRINYKFPTFLLIFRIFSNINCLDFQINSDNFLGTKIKEAILLGLKSRSNEIFQKSDINWLGLLINNSEVNNYISPKMTYIYRYLENLCDYTFKPDEDNKINYDIIIKKMVESLLNVIFAGKIEEIFSEEIPKIETDENSKTKDKIIKDILYITKLPNIIQIILKEEILKQEKKLYSKFSEDIKYINKVYKDNSKLFSEFIEAIEADTEEEKKRRIEDHYNKAKNQKEESCKNTEGKWSGYLESINNINETELSFENYNKEMSKIIEAEEYLNSKNKKYFNKKVTLHTCFKIIFKNESKKGTLSFGESSKKLNNIRINSVYYINSKNIKINSIKAVNSKDKNIEIEKKVYKLYDINKDFAKQEFEKAQKEIEKIEKEKPKNIKVILIINKNQKIDTNKIKDNDNFKKLEKIMGESGLKKNLAISEEIISKGDFSIDKIKPRIKNLKEHFENLKNLEFYTPKFENPKGSPSLTNAYCDKYKNEFKDMIIGKLESLIKFYDNFDLLKKKAKINMESFDDKFSLEVFEKKRPKQKKLKVEKPDKFSINYPYIALISDSDIYKLQFGYSSYKITIGPIIASFYSGTKYIYNIVSFVDKKLEVKIVFNEDIIDEEAKKLISCFSVKNKIPPNEPIPIIFTVPKIIIDTKRKNYKFKGYLEIKIEDSEIEPLSIDFAFNVILLPLEIIFKSLNGKMFWDENKLVLQANSFRQNEILKFNYIIRNFKEDISFLNKNYSLKSLEKNEVDEKPIIIQQIDKKNFYDIILPKIDKKLEYLEGLFKIYFTNTMNIPIEISGKIKKPDFKVFYYDSVYNKIEENRASVYVYKHNFKHKKPFDIEMIFRLELFDKEEHKFELILPKNYYPQYYLSFYLKGEDPKYNVNVYTSDKMKEGINLHIIAHFPENYTDSSNKKIFFFKIDDLIQKEIPINIKKESISYDNTKFQKFPYKTLIKDNYVMINEKIEKDILSQKENPIVCYSPYSVKFFKLIPDIIIEPEKKNKGYFIDDDIKLIIFVKEFDNYWVPNCHYFGDNKFDDYKILDVKSENIDKAVFIITDIFNDIRAQYIYFSNYRKYDYSEIKKNAKEDLNKYGYFLDFILLLVSDNLSLKNKCKKLEKLFKMMGEEYLDIFSRLLVDLPEDDKIKKINENKKGMLDTSNNKDIINENIKQRDDIELQLNDLKAGEDENYSLSIIVFYNIIVELRKYLQIRYDMLKENKFNISKMFRKYEKYKYMKNIEKCFPKYDEKEFNSMIKKLMITKNDYKNIKGKLSQAWLFNEKTIEPEVIEKDYIENDDFDKNSFKAEGKSLDLNLDILKIQDLSEANTLNKIIMVLNNGFTIAQAFMFCIGKINKEKTNEIFNYLYEIYHKTKNSTKSILSNEIKLFTNSFENLCRSLKAVDVDLSKFEDIPNLKKKSDIILNVEKPLPNIYGFTSGINWRGKKGTISRYDDKKEQEEVKIIMNEEAAPSSTKEKEKVDKSKEELKNKMEAPEMVKKKVEFGKVGGKAIDILNDNSEDEEDKEIKELEKIHLGKTDVIIEVKEEEINKLKSISDEGVTNTIVKRMLKKAVDSKLNLCDNFPEFKKDLYMKKTLNRKEGDDYVDQPLFSLFNELSKNLFIKLYQQCTNFDRNEVCAVIGIDLCRTIDRKYKLFHTIIANAMAQCFNSIEIPYSIVVFCDYGVQFIIKDFDDDHQEEISQLIFDCIMVPRCCTRIADACYFISQKVNCKDRINKRVFIISNGLDTKLKIGEKWGAIFNNEKEKFCFYFVKPDLNESDMNEIIKIWDDFQEKTKTEIAKISIEEILNGKSSTFLPFKNIMQSDIYKNFEEIKRMKITQPEFKEIVKFDKEDYFKLLNSINTDIINSREYFVQNRLHIPSKGKYKLEDYIIKNPFSSLRGECFSEDYNLDSISKDTNSALEKIFSHQIASEIKLEYLEFVFTPNKPSMYSPSTKGTRLYLMGLINFCITRGQDNKIWLEKNKGLKKDYRVSVIIDSSISCFNDYMRPHSIKTVLSIMRMISLVEIPFFDLIIATPTKPIVLSCGNDTTNSLNIKSNLWNILLEQLTYNGKGCNLLDALQLVYKLKSMNTAKKYYTFILTDGMMDKKDSDEFQDYVSFCEESNLEVYGIGLGYYPEGIKKIFNKCIWSLNPFMILKAMTVFFGNTEKHLENIDKISFPQRYLGEVLDKFTIIINKFNSYQEYKNLYGYLDGLPLLMQSFDEVTNPDKADETGVINPEISENNTMCKKEEFEGFKILIGMFWSHDLSEKESDWVDKRYLLERFDKDKECLKEVLSYYSIDLVIKEDYKDCIKELEKGIYYAHWIICGDGSGKLPKKDGNANLVGQYIDALRIYWTNGGSLVFWNDNYPFTYECNLFLERVEFPGEISKTNVRFGGNHEGKNIMKPGDISSNIPEGSEFGKFNNKKYFNDGKYFMFSLGHNLVKIAEGTTISYVVNPKDKTTPSNNIAPFNIFGYEHQGGANILFFTPPLKYNHGYLIIDGGFTKLFNELDSDGTKRYILNIASFTTQFVKRYGEIGENWKTDFKITPFSYTLDETVKWNGFNLSISNEFDIVYLLDATGSMGSYLAAARDQCINISNQLKSELSKFDFNFGAVFYRDPVDCHGEKNHTYALKKDVNILKSELSSERASGGGDGPEDWVGGYEMALDNIAWRNGTRLIIHIADAPAHGSEWCNENNHNEENSKLYPIIQKCVDKNIKIIGFQIGSYPKPSFEKFQKEYNNRGGKLYKIQVFKSGMSSSEISTHFKDMVVSSTHAAAPK